MIEARLTLEVPSCMTNAAEIRRLRYLLNVAQREAMDVFIVHEGRDEEWSTTGPGVETVALAVVPKDVDPVEDVKAVLKDLEPQHVSVDPPEEDGEAATNPVAEDEGASTSEPDEGEDDPQSEAPPPAFPSSGSLPKHLKINVPVARDLKGERSWRIFAGVVKKHIDVLYRKDAGSVSGFAAFFPLNNDDPPHRPKCEWVRAMAMEAGVPLDSLLLKRGVAQPWPDEAEADDEDWHAGMARNPKRRRFPDKPPAGHTRIPVEEHESWSEL